MKCMSRPRTGRGKKRARGYLLIEGMVAGSILAVTLAATYGHLASGRSKTSRASQRAMAASLARAEADALMNGTPGASSQTWTTIPGFSRFEVASTVSDSGLGAQSNPGLTTVIYDVTVQIRYLCEEKSAEDVADGTVDGKAIYTFQRLWGER